MRYGILGDIHSNLSALDAVLAEMSREGVDRYISVGDLVGYGAEPIAVMDRVLELKPIVVCGNHDLACIQKLDLQYFNNYAREAILWTRKVLPKKYVQVINGLKLVETESEVTVVHGALFRPEEFDYIQTTIDARNTIDLMKTRLCFVGHSHIPVAFLQKNEEPEKIAYTFDSDIELKGWSKILVNVGSIGQPRDENPKAAYAIYDTDLDKVWIRRVTYDIEKEAQKILRAGLPRMLADRLKLGV